MAASYFAYWVMSRAQNEMAVAPIGLLPLLKWEDGDGWKEGRQLHRAIFPGEHGFRFWVFGWVFSGKVAHQSQRYHDISSRLSVGTKVGSSRSDMRTRASDAASTTGCAILTVPWEARGLVTNVFPGHHPS